MTKEQLAEIAKGWPAADYWDPSDDTERLSHSDVLEAVEEAIENLPEGPLELRMREAWPESLTVYGWTRKTIDIDHLAESAFERISDEWHEEYGDPDSDSADLPKNLGELLRAAVAEAFEKHPVWSCEQDIELDIPIDQLVEIARCEWPDWFEVKP